MRVMIAEDELISRKMLQSMLTEWGYQVVVAADGREAWRVLQEPDAPRIALLDWTMPEMDGVEICRRLRERQTPTPTFVILISARTATADIVTGLESGAHEYITKPFDAAELRARLRVAQTVTELQESVAMHSQVLLAMKEQVALIDEQGVVMFTNHAFDAMFGFAPGEQIGRPIVLFDELSSAEHAKRLGEIVSSVEQSGVWSSDICHTRADGSSFWTEAQVSRVLVSGKVSYVVVQQDITQRRLAEEQTASLREQLAHGSRLTTLGHMAAGLAHEINQPLAALRLYATAVEDMVATLDVPDLLDCVKRIDQQSLRAAEIMRRMRNFANLGSNKREEIEINRLIQEVLAILEHEFKRGRVRVDVRLAKDAPCIRCDAIQIQQVLVNLIRNAVEAMNDTEFDDRVLTIEASVENEQVSVRISDAGCGIDPDKMDTLFKPFRSSKASGMGIGLSICRTIVEAHGGSISVEPNAPRGTTFNFAIPLAEPARTA